MIEFLNDSPITAPMIFDTHAHYDDLKFDDFRDELLSNLPLHGVGNIVNCGCDKQSSLKSLSLAEKFPYIYAAVGIHPGNIESGTTICDIEELAKSKKCVAIGEIGLDYYWTQDNKQEQKNIFEEQLILANKLNLPVIVHDREAHADTLELLKKHRPSGVVHSFSGSPEMAAEIISLGMYIGIGGVITFNNARRLPEVVKMLPDDRILLETDAPYLTPVPYRSKINNSAMIYFTAKKIAEIRKTDIEHIFEITYRNAEKIFKI